MVAGDEVHGEQYENIWVSSSFQKLHLVAFTLVAELVLLFSVWFSTPPLPHLLNERSSLRGVDGEQLSSAPALVCQRTCFSSLFTPFLLLFISEQHFMSSDVLLGCCHSNTTLFSLMLACV